MHAVCGRDICSIRYQLICSGPLCTAGAFVGPDGKTLAVPEGLPNAHMRLFGGAQYHRAMAEFRASIGELTCPDIRCARLIRLRLYASRRPGLAQSWPDACASGPPAQCMPARPSSSCSTQARLPHVNDYVLCADLRGPPSWLW